MTTIRTDEVWKALDDNLFLVVGMVNAEKQGRTAGVVYVVADGRLWFTTDADAWKVRHLRGTPDVSVTVPVPRGAPLSSFVPIPPATVTFSATAEVHAIEDVPPEVVAKLTRGVELPAEKRRGMVAVSLTPVGEFVTYGIGVSLLGMRDTVRARGRTPVGVG